MSGLFSMDAWSTVWNHKESFLLGLGNTLQTAVCALALAFAIGALLGLMATSGNQILKFVARVYVEFIQNTPLLLQLCFLYYALAHCGTKRILLRRLRCFPLAFSSRAFSRLPCGRMSGCVKRAKWTGRATRR